MKKLFLALLSVPLLLGALEIVPAGKKYLYRTGETAVFEIDLGPEAARKLFRISIKGKIKKDFSAVAGENGKKSVPVSLNEPGFICISVDFDGKKAAAGIAFEPEKIRSGRPCPEEFDRFWGNIIRKLDIFPMKYELEEIKTGVPEKFKAFQVRITMPDEANPVYAILSMPKDSAPGRTPALLLFHGAGADTIRPAYRNNCLTLTVNPMPIRHNGKPGSSIYPEGARFKNYWHWGTDDLKKNFFVGMYQRVYRSLQFVKNLPEWDQRTLMVSGASQGGAQALAAAGLDPQVTFCAAYIPALCDHGGTLRNGDPGWPRYNSTAVYKNDPEKAAKVLDMIDAVNFAARIRNAEVVVSTGFIDRVCVPSSVYAAYNAIASPSKRIFNDFCLAHRVSAETKRETGKLMNEHIRQKRIK